MAKKPYELALNDYILGMSYKDIAAKYKVGIDTVKKWKTRYGWNRDNIPRQQKTVSTLSTKKTKVDKGGQPEEADPELTDIEQLFCYHYVRTHNATQAALKSGYSQHKPSAAVLGCRLLQRPRVKAEIDRLKALFRQDIHLDIQDFLQFCMRIVGADIGDYLKFGAVDRFVYDDDGPIKDPDTGEYLKEPVNCISLGESEQLDTSVIQEVKQGKDGISIKLADKKWAWEQLIKYFDWLPDKWRRRIDEDRLELERRRVAAAEKKAGDNDKEKPINITIKRKVKSDG
ncbi:terminase small subunit [Sporomusa sphaeroides DSM 2875]|uniref:terminase small subunit n=1 Tax=Sporomusa sphaeroides TaxID=47679 RepID=UPI00202F63C5|nr:terminase small subunit [Sporomusa sphaeroides]MCM0759960.1 terminase small subunit [Sporomusa sphaeroides DSM 2875]